MIRNVGLLFLLITTLGLQAIPATVIYQRVLLRNQHAVLAKTICTTYNKLLHVEGVRPDFLVNILQFAKFPDLSNTLWMFDPNSGHTELYYGMHEYGFLPDYTHDELAVIINSIYHGENEPALINPIHNDIDGQALREILAIDNRD